MTDSKIPALRIMAYLDGELPPEKRLEFERLLEEHPEWKAEVAEQARILAATRTLRIKPPNPHVWDNYWEEIDARLSKQVGWLTALVGAAILLAFGLWKAFLWADNDYVRFGLSLVVVGVGLLFAIVLRGRLIEIPRDRYRRIKR